MEGGDLGLIIGNPRRLKPGTETIGLKFLQTLLLEQEQAGEG